jgi:hypothetical protein
MLGHAEHVEGAAQFRLARGGERELVEGGVEGAGHDLAALAPRRRHQDDPGSATDEVREESAGGDGLVVGVCVQQEDGAGSVEDAHRGPVARARR